MKIVMMNVMMMNSGSDRSSSSGGGGGSYARPVRERGPSTMLFSYDLPKGLSEPVFQSGELDIIKGLTGRKPETGCFAWRFSQKQAPTKTGKSYSKPETVCFARRFCHSENRRTAGPPRSQSKVSIYWLTFESVSLYHSINNFRIKSFSKRKGFCEARTRDLCRVKAAL